jgi:hypothetical protein
MLKVIQRPGVIIILGLVWLVAFVYLLYSVTSAYFHPQQAKFEENAIENCLKSAEESRASRWEKACKPRNEQLIRQIAKCKNPTARASLTGKECMGSTCRNAGGLFGLDKDVAQTIDLQYDEAREACFKRYPQDASLF